MEGFLIYLLFLIVPFLILLILEREQTTRTYYKNGLLKTEYVFRNYVFSKKHIISDKGWYKNGQLEYDIEYWKEEKSTETRYYEDGQIESKHEHQLPLLFNTLHKSFDTEGNITKYVGFKSSSWDEYGTDKYSEKSKSKIFIQPNIEELLRKQISLKISQNKSLSSEDMDKIIFQKFDFNDVDYQNEVNESLKRGFWLKNPDYDYKEEDFYLTITKRKIFYH